MGGCLLRWAGGFDKDFLTSKGNYRGDCTNSWDGRKLQPDPFRRSIESQAGHQPFAQHCAIQFRLAGCERNIFRTEQYLDPSVRAQASRIFRKSKDMRANLDLFSLRMPQQDIRRPKKRG